MFAANETMPLTSSSWDRTNRSDFWTFSWKNAVRTSNSSSTKNGQLMCEIFFLCRLAFAFFSRLLIHSLCSFSAGGCCEVHLRVFFSSSYFTHSAHHILLRRSGGFSHIKWYNTAHRRIEFKSNQIESNEMDRYYILSLSMVAAVIIYSFYTWMILLWYRWDKPGRINVSTLAHAIRLTASNFTLLRIFSTASNPPNKKKIVNKIKIKIQNNKLFTTTSFFLQCACKRSCFDHQSIYE